MQDFVVGLALLALVALIIGIINVAYPIKTMKITNRSQALAVSGIALCVFVLSLSIVSGIEDEDAQKREPFDPDRAVRSINQNCVDVADAKEAQFLHFTFLRLLEETHGPMDASTDAGLLEDMHRISTLHGIGTQGCTSAWTKYLSARLDGKKREEALVWAEVASRN